MNRLSEIDFLRGIAVILVMLSHHWLFDLTQRVGWVGVDLFFVLSGYLVSGLLFSEYKKFDNIKPIHFLIRRGFKIYPLFYFSIIFSVIIFVGFYYTNENRGILRAFIPELIFMQNYYSGYWGHHWSLAVEEHFYIFLTILIYLLIKQKILNNYKFFLLIAIFIFVGCLSLRFYAFNYQPSRFKFGETHLRIDSLFAGVLIAYFYNFKHDQLKEFYHKYKPFIIALTFLPLFFIPFLNIFDSGFLKIYGFSLLYIAFGSLLLVFLFTPEIGKKLEKVCSKRLYTIITGIGFYSYSIYLFHNYYNQYINNYAYTDVIPDRVMSTRIFVDFIAFFVVSITLGIVLSKLIEIPFLKLRDKYFPRRQKDVVLSDRQENI